MYNAKRSAERFSPASTFKVPNTPSRFRKRRSTALT